jgi:hypothetical protein
MTLRQKNLQHLDKKVKVAAATAKVLVEGGADIPVSYTRKARSC